MTQLELRNTIVKLLYAALGGPKVVLSDQVMPEADYPYVTYQSVQQRIPGPYNIRQSAVDGAVTQRRDEHAEATYSFSACSRNRTDGQGTKVSGDDEALTLAEKAQGFFLFTGRQLLAAKGVVVVSVENTQNRSALDGEETDRRYGFDVRFRYERMDTRAVPAMKPPII